MTRTKMAEIAPFGLRLQPELHAKISALAEANARSMNAEITVAIEKHVNGLTPDDILRHVYALEAHMSLDAISRIEAAQSPSLRSLVTRLEAAVKVLEAKAPVDYSMICPIEGQSIGDTLKRMREAAGLTQKELADAIGASQGSVSKWEAGTSMPDGYHLVKLQSVFASKSVGG